MIEGRDIVLEFANRSKKPIPVNIKYMWVDGEQAVKLFDKVNDLRDKHAKIRELYRALKPYAIAGLKMGAAL